MEHHRVKAVYFSKAIESQDSPIDCTCGWQGLVSEFKDHRASFGLKVRTPSQYLRTEGDVNVWRAEYRRTWATR